jgi:UDP-N-acetylmuramyl tripeptide synthase
MDISKKPRGGIKPTLQKVKAKTFGFYYGHPVKDMKLITVTGTTNNAVTANFINEIIKSSNDRSAILTVESNKPITMGKLHKFLSHSWKEGANYVVIEAPVSTIEKLVLHSLPIHIAVLTDTPEHNKLFTNPPAHMVVSRDNDDHDTTDTPILSMDTVVTYGRHRDAHVRVDHSKLYKKGTEANLVHGTQMFQVATFVTGEESVPLMAAAAAAAKVLNLSNDAIVDGIANYEPKA